MPFGIYSTAELIGVTRVMPVESSYFLDNFFGRQINFTTEDILFDKVTMIRRLAPFVSPVVQGRVMRTRGFETRSFAPAYTKPKHVVDPNQQFSRMIGEALGGGSVTPEQRYNAAVANNLQEERNSIMRLWNWMGAMAIINGSVTVTGEDYPTRVVDFNRNAGLTVALSGTARWGESAADPLGDVAALRKLAFEKGGAPITRLTMGLDAFDLFFADTTVQALLKTELGAIPRTSDSTMSAMGSPGEPFEFRGVLQGANGQGRLEVYTYNEQYEDEDGQTQSIMGSYDVVGTGTGVDGVRCFGAIRDKRAGLQALPMFPKMWDQEDPSVTYTMTQSAPLMVPSNPDNTFKLTVFA